MVNKKCATVDLDQNLVSDPSNQNIRQHVLDHIDYVADWTRTDIFLLKPKKVDGDDMHVDGALDNSLDHRYRVVIYGDAESSEHAKVRILIMIDQIVREIAD